MKTLLLIGGSGFFGKSFLAAFQQGQLSPWGIDKVIVLSRNAKQLQIECPQLISAQVELINSDIANAMTLPYADIVIHAAASTDAARYISQGEAERQNIQSGVKNFCQLAVKFCADSKILFVSSGAVYGQQPEDMLTISENFLFTELSQNPRFSHKLDYAYAKRDAEQHIRHLAQQNLHVSIARCFAFVGPWLPRNQHFAIGNFIADGINKSPITVKARLAVYRSYMYADELVRWLMTIAVNATTDCPIYNVGSDKAMLIGDVAHMVARLCECETEIPVLDDPCVDRYIPSIEKAKNELGLTIEIDLEAAIKKTLAGIIRC